MMQVEQMNSPTCLFYWLLVIRFQFLSLFSPQPTTFNRSRLASTLAIPEISSFSFSTFHWNFSHCLVIINFFLWMHTHSMCNLYYIIDPYISENKIIQGLGWRKRCLRSSWRIECFKILKKRRQTFPSNFFLIPS